MSRQLVGTAVCATIIEMSERSQQPKQVGKGPPVQELSLYALKLHLTRNRHLDSTPATTEVIASLARRHHSWAQEAIQILRTQGFIIASISGPIFARHDPAYFLERQGYLSVLESLAATHALEKMNRDSAARLHEHLTQIEQYIVRHDPFHSIAQVNSLLLTLFDLAGLATLKVIYRSRANEAVAYAWADRLSQSELQAVLAICQKLVAMLEQGNLLAARYAGRVREAASLASITDLEQQAA